MSGPDISRQFAKLCPRFADLDMTCQERLETVENALAASRRAAGRSEQLPHWTYDANRHLALVELRNALGIECLRRKAA